MTVRPVNRRLVVIPYQKKAKELASGLAIPGAADPYSMDDHSEGVVLAAAAGVTTARRGDRVIYTHYSGIALTVEGQKYIIIRDVDVLALVTEDPSEPVVD